MRPTRLFEILKEGVASRWRFLLIENQSGKLSTFSLRMRHLNMAGMAQHLKIGLVVDTGLRPWPTR
jgi:hypothetical protein